MILHNQRYYIMAYSEYWGNMVFHRLDRITNMIVSDKKATPIRNVPGYENGINYKELSSAMPYMYTDRPEHIDFIADAGIIDQIIDWFGGDVRIAKTDDESKVRVSVKASPNAIPLYQRAYAWGDKQLIQLVEDISDVSEDANYYIGSLIVSKQNGEYEVVDGQQRLTSLYLLLNCLGLNVKHTLTFACREKSNYTLQNIQELLHEDRSKLDMERIEQEIQRGIKILDQELNRDRTQ